MKLSPEKKELINALSLLSILIVIGIFSSNIVGFIGKGFDTQSVINQFTFYVGLALGGSLLIISLIVIELLISKGDKKYANSVAFSSQGESPALPFFKRFDSLQLFLGSLIISIFLRFFSLGIENKSFTGVAVIQQQFTELGNVVFSVLLVPIAENFAFMGIMAFLIFSLRQLSRKYGWSKNQFRSLSLILIPIIMGFVGLGNHNLVFGSSELNLTIVYFFWYFLALIVILVGNFIVGWTPHLINNLVFLLLGFMNSDNVTIYLILGLIISIVLLFFYTNSKNKRKTSLQT